jgi:hypothetical protein
MLLALPHSPLSRHYRRILVPQCSHEASCGSPADAADHRQLLFCSLPGSWMTQCLVRDFALSHVLYILRTRIGVSSPKFTTVLARAKTIVGGSPVLVCTSLSDSEGTW